MPVLETGDIRVAIVSDQRVFGESLAFALDDDEGISIDAVVSRWDEPGLRSRRILVVIVDLEGLQTTIEFAVPQIRKQAPRAGIIVLSSRSNAETLRSSVDSGADGHVSKDKGLDELRRAIHCVAGGIAYLDANQTPSEAGGREFARGPNVQLSPREREVLGLLTEGHANREIAIRLNVAHKTVKNHVSNILSKLDTSSRTQAVIHAIRAGII
jgi:two-component system NarL family response regulator